MKHVSIPPGDHHRNRHPESGPWPLVLIFAFFNADLRMAVARLSGGIWHLFRACNLPAVWVHAGGDAERSCAGHKCAGAVGQVLLETGGNRVEALATDVRRPEKFAGLAFGFETLVMWRGRDAPSGCQWLQKRM